MKNKDYKVKINIEHGATFLSITHNGLAWSSVQIKDVKEEIPLIISELTRHLTAVEVGAFCRCESPDIVWNHNQTKWTCIFCGAKGTT